MTHFSLRSNPEIYYRFRLRKTIGWKELLLHLVPTWHQKGTHLHDLDWPKNQAFTMEEIKKVPTWDEKGTQLLRLKVLYLISILILATEPIKLTELLKIFDYKSEKKFNGKVHHFPDVRKMIALGKGAEKEIDVTLLTRYASYLVAQNGDSRKEEIGLTQEGRTFDKHTK